MKSLTLLALAALSVTSAFAQNEMKKDHMIPKAMPKHQMMKMHSSMAMKGLNKSEMKTAHQMMSMMSHEDMAACMKMCNNMKMSGAEKMRATKAMKNMTGAEKKVCMKMAKMHTKGMMKMKPMMKHG